MSTTPGNKKLSISVHDKLLKLLVSVHCVVNYNVAFDSYPSYITVWLFNRDPAYSTVLFNSENDMKLSFSPNEMDERKQNLEGVGGVGGGCTWGGRETHVRGYVAREGTHVEEGGGGGRDIWDGMLSECPIIRARGRGGGRAVLPKFAFKDFPHMHNFSSAQN